VAGRVAKGDQPATNGRSAGGGASQNPASAAGGR
jgi:hypothetical protein